MTRSRVPSSEELVELAGKLRSKLLEMDLDLQSNPLLDSVPIHLADVFEICANYQCLIERLLALPAHPPKAEVDRFVDDIRYHLYEHLPYHLKRLAKVLNDLKMPIRKKAVKTSRTGRGRQRKVPSTK